LGFYVSASRLARPASSTGELLDPGGGEEARRLGGGGRGERATLVNGGECREAEWRNIASSSFFRRCDFFKAVEGSS
jgi:hypothetical protein